MAESLRHAYRRFGGMKQSEVPWLVWLLENPDSPLALAGAIPLKEHDYLHILLNRGKSPDDEAFIIGFTMGNDIHLNKIHIWIFKRVVRFLYPTDYRLTLKQLESFDLGLQLGKQLPTKNLCRFDYSSVESWSVDRVRAILHLNPMVSLAKSDR
ncbi:hypothetical protein C1752_03904 [Acaryochloris thomasi RCC1774]|uniref:Uncharacterized protein n=1 Tax=Acaryochloris thomasi RCC1774 TaxID=1764569 RepID=A0A2W1JUW7_9CYAN|nr:hypothetical protein [Acaryochloris thomasi]PZD72317.1 hypothetical protein C1752_03904 [Acaryochloris thomasi RCC1774]